MSSLDLAKIGTGDERRRTRITWDSCASCMKRKWRYFCMSGRRKLTRGEDADLEKHPESCHQGRSRRHHDRGGQRQTKHGWDDAGDGDDKNRVQMINDERDDANDSQALTGGDITKYRARVARISHLSHDRLDLKFAAMQVCCAMAKPMEWAKRVGRYLAALVPLVLRAGSVFRRRLRGRQSPSTIGVSWSYHERGEGHGQCMKVEPTSGCHSNDVLGQPQRAGQGKTQRHAELHK